MQDTSGKPIIGFSLDDSPTVIGNEISRVVHWRSGKSLNGLAGEPVRMRISR